MNLFSQFQCVQAINNDSKEEGWKYNKLGGESVVEADNAYEYVFNECEKKPGCVEDNPGDCLRCRRLKINEAGNGEACEASESTMCDNGVNQNENKVGFVAIRYRFEDRDTKDGQCGGVDSDRADKYFCPNNVTASTKIGQRKDIPRDLRGCVAEEMFEDKLCPNPGDFEDDNEKGRLPMIRGLSLSPYGKISCYKEAICGDKFSDAGETCDYSMTENNWNRTCSRGDAPCACVANREDTLFNAASPATLNINANGTVSLPDDTYLVGDYAKDAWFKMSLSNYDKALSSFHDDEGLNTNGENGDIHADCDEHDSHNCEDAVVRKRMKIKVKQGYTFKFFKSKPGSADSNSGEFTTDSGMVNRHSNTKHTCDSGSYREFEFFDKEPEVKWGVHWKDATEDQYNGGSGTFVQNQDGGHGGHLCQEILDWVEEVETVSNETTTTQDVPHYRYACPYDVKYYVPGYYDGHGQGSDNGTDTAYGEGKKNNYQNGGGDRWTVDGISVGDVVPRYKEPRNGDDLWVRVRRNSYNFPAQNECSKPLDLALCMDDTRQHSTVSDDGECNNPSF